MKIVVRGTNWVGDAVMTIPALRELRRIFPDSQISLYIRAWTKGIFQDALFIDELITFDREKSSFKTVLSQAKIWREEKFDLAVLFPNSFESALLAKLGKVPQRFGYAKDGRSFLLTNAVKIPDWKNKRHEVFYYLNLVAEIEKRFFGTSTALESEPRFELTVSESRKAEARKFLAQNGVDLPKKIIVFCAGSANSPAKRWETSSFAKLGDMLKSNLDVEVVLDGAKNEVEISQEVAAKMLTKPIVLTGKTSLAEGMAILSVADLLVSNDTGAAHISAALGTKTLVIFGPTNPLTTQPLGSEIIRQDVECSPCNFRVCPIDHRCMTRISADEVFRKAAQLLITNKD
ncbi:MAG: lipopolysaccharide heptosyltransferase II [Acidobacteriota bacterium]|nr:lipopolysaccharide heptosyltransferase II [Acidobacteriota bacterium]